MSASDGIIPDDKDWTWVLAQPCPDCGFDASTVPPDDVAGLVRDNAAIWWRLVEGGVVRSGRTDPSRWSSLEYLCHVRDIYVRYDGRVRLMLAEDDPLFPSWDQDASAVEDRYDEQNPVEVAAALAAAADVMAATLEGVAGTAWGRTGRRSDGAAFTVDQRARRASSSSWRSTSGGGTRPGRSSASWAKTAPRVPS